MTVKDLKQLMIFCVVVVFAAAVMFAEQTLDEQQDAIINQEAYFYGMSHLLNEEDMEVVVSEEDILESKAFFWGVHF